jgi:hypothetical protein
VFLSITLFVGLCAGGAASIGGTIVGAIFIEFVPNLADKVSKAAPGAVYGVILIAMLFLMPQGAGGFLSGLWRKVIKLTTNAPAERRPAAVGQDTGLGIDLTGSLSRADRLHSVRGEAAEGSAER